MIELKNITVKEYFELEDTSKYDFAMKYAIRFTDPVDEFKLEDFFEQKCGLVKDFQYDYERGLSFAQSFDYACKFSQKELHNEKLDVVCRFIRYLIEQLINIIKVEREVLSHDANEDEERAGLERFENIGIYLQLRSVAITFNTTPQHIKEWTYSELLAEMFTAKQVSDYQREYNKIVNEKHK